MATAKSTHQVGRFAIALAATAASSASAQASNALAVAAITLNRCLVQHVSRVHHVQVVPRVDVTEAHRAIKAFHNPMDAATRATTVQRVISHVEPLRRRQAHAPVQMRPPQVARRLQLSRTLYPRIWVCQCRSRSVINKKLVIK
jgi:hypothetical protein